MKLSVLVVLLMLLGVLNAYQSLSPNQFLYNNVTLGNNSSIIAGVDTNGILNLIVINSAYYKSWLNGQRVHELYNSTVGSGIYQVNLTGGTYTVIFLASSNLRVSADAYGFSKGRGHIINIDNVYRYNLVLDRYSTINISVLTDRNFQAFPLTINVSGHSSTLNDDSNFDSLYGLNLDRGTYRIVLTSSAPTEAFLSIYNSNSVINPLADFNASRGYPVGVVSYGVYNNSGALEPYRIATSEVVGDANITTLRAQDFNSTINNNSAYGASLQLNVELNTQRDNLSRVFWLQDVVDFNTSHKSYYLVNNIWNNTLPDANLGNNTLKGYGKFTLCVSCGNQRFYANSYPAGHFNYSLPFNIKLVMLENRTANGTAVSFGYQVLQNGSVGLRPLVFYDRVLFPGYTNSTMLVTPDFYTPSSNNQSGNYYDAELVFAGESGGAQSYFSSLAANMWIYYLANGTLVPFPSAYTFGQDTAETAANVRVLPTNHGKGGFATTGSLDPAEQIVIGNGINTTAKYLQNSSQITSLPTTTFQQSVITIPALTGTGIAVTRGTLLGYVVLLLIIVAILMVLKLILSKSR